MNIPGRRIESGEIVITEPFARGGDGMFLRAQVLDSSGVSGNINVAVFTRNEADNAWPGTAIGNVDLSTTNNGDITELHIATGATGSIEQQLRLKITGPSAGWVLMRVFPPLFYDAAVGSAS